MKFNLIILFFFLFSMAFAQEKRTAAYTHHAATYEATWVTDTTQPQTKYKASYYLLFTDEYSLFLPARNYYTDTLEASGVLTLENMNTYFMKAPKVAAGISTDFSKVYKYPKKARLSTFKRFGGKSLYYEEDLNNCTWQIHPEKRSLAGYDCQRATTTFAGRDYEAWFTLTIPQRDGPYKFNGLPGLIVKISDTQGHYSFTLTNFKAKRLPAFEPDRRRLTVTSKADYYERERKFWQSITASNKAAGVSVTPLNNASPEAEKRREKARRKRYNPIERIPKPNSK